MTPLQAPAARLVEQIEALAPETPWTPEHEFVVAPREARLSVDLPGVRRGNLRVACEEGRLRVWGRRLPSPCPGALAHRTTRRSGEFALEVELPAWVDPTRAVQTFGEGILTVVLPRRRESQPSAHGPL